MNTKNLDAIKRMVTRLQAIKETDDLELVDYQIDCVLEYLQHIVDIYDPIKNHPSQIRTE